MRAFLIIIFVVAIFTFSRGQAVDQVEIPAGKTYEIMVGAVGNFFFYDTSTETGTAGVGGSVLATYVNRKHFFAQGRIGYLSLGPAGNNRDVLQFSGALGYTDGPFAAALEVGNLQFTNEAEQSGMSFGLMGQFAIPIGDRWCFLAGMRAGIMARIKTTYYQSAYLGAAYRL